MYTGSPALVVLILSPCSQSRVSVLKVFSVFCGRANKIIGRCAKGGRVISPARIETLHGRLGVFRVLGLIQPVSCHRRIGGEMVHTP